MLRKFREMVNNVLDTSQKFGIISHTERNRSIDRVLVSRDAVFFLINRVGFISPARRTAWFHGIGHM